MIADAVRGKIDCIQAADAIISLINTANEQAIEDYIWSAKTVHKLDNDAKVDDRMGCRRQDDGIDEYINIRKNENKDKDVAASLALPPYNF